VGVCRATKRNGEPCTASATASDGYCWAHDPANAEKRQRMASRAGRSRPGREIKDVKALCEDLTERVLSGELLPGPAAVANQLINTRLRAIEQERRLKETEELEGRIEALERQQDTGRGRRWG
jgi:hypothetical protein